MELLQELREVVNEQRRRFDASAGLAPASRRSAIDPHYHEVRELTHAAPHSLREVEHFFRIYKELEGKPGEALGWEGRITAEQAIQTRLAAR